jgi:hypothetical protein
VQPARDHQVDHKPQISVEAESDSLSDTPQPEDSSAFHGGNGRVGSAEDEWTGKPHSLKRLARDSRFERADVGSDIRQLGHVYLIFEQLPKPLGVYG